MRQVSFDAQCDTAQRLTNSLGTRATRNQTMANDRLGSDMKVPTFDGHLNQSNTG